MSGYLFTISIFLSLHSMTCEEKPIVSVCPSPIIVSEGENVTCQCKGQGGNIPGHPNVNVTWFKNGAQISDTVFQENMLILRDVNETNSGSYICRVQNHIKIKNERSIELIVEYPPKKPELVIIPKTVNVGKSVTMICSAKAVPEPTNYSIVHNNVKIIDNNGTYTIEVVNENHAGSYNCIVENKHGNSSSKTYKLNVKSNSIKPTLAILGVLFYLHWQIISAKSCWNFFRRTYRRFWSRTSPERMGSISIKL